MIPCTVGILSYNNAETLPDTLAALSSFAQIVVCDGGSTDGTREIAEKAGVKLIDQDRAFKRIDGKIADFAGVRNQMLDAAECDWFLYVDSDEILSPALIAEIAQVVEHSSPAAFWMPRKYVVDGVVIECATTYPNRQIRLFHRAAVKKFIKTIHERIELLPEAKISFLENFMLVPIKNDPVGIRKKWDYYLDLEVDRQKNIRLSGWVRGTAQNIKVSTLYLYRLVRNFLICRGPRMPLSLELQRHQYHLSMSVRLFDRMMRNYLS
jgi:glycosyltransferase involved in cell wall biosynthesis